MENESEQPKSKYDPLVTPEFKSSIPPHLVGRLSDQERYTVEALSKMEQTNAYFLTVLVQLKAAIIDLDLRQQRVELWKGRLTSKWALIAGAAAMALPVLLKALADRFLKGP